MSSAYNGDPVVVEFALSDATGQPSAPTGSLRAWGVLAGRVVNATSIVTQGSTVFASFPGTLNAPGNWTVYLEETVAGTSPNIIGSRQVMLAQAQRPGS